MEYCRLIYQDAKIESVGPTADGTDLNHIYETDERYGVFRPRNGDYFTFRILDVHDEEITHKDVRRAVLLAFQSYTKRFAFDVKPAKPWEEPDFKLIFRTSQNDERGVMTENTIMYHYFPINDINDPRRGLCVINPKYYYTAHGNPLPMYIIDPDNYTETDTATGGTIDLDGVLRHEFGHGFGLPHVPIPNTTLSTPYSVLNEFLDEITVMRMFKKGYGYRKQSANRLVRWLKYIWHRSERY